jgi:hypothetical protein
MEDIHDLIYPTNDGGHRSHQGESALNPGCQDAGKLLQMKPSPAVADLSRHPDEGFLGWWGNGDNVRDWDLLIHEII